MTDEMCENRNMRDVRIALLTASISLVLLGAYVVYITTGAGKGIQDELLTVSFLDVGQGDAAFIESPVGVQVLIDGGKDGRVLNALAKELASNDRTLDVVVATHPDADHIGGLIDVLAQYEVKNIVLTEQPSDTPVYDAFMDAVSKEGAVITYAHTGQIFTLGNGAHGTTTLTIRSPAMHAHDRESNRISIVAQLRYGDIDFLFTADAPIEIEQYLVSTFGNSLQSEVLKVGHHGSRTSSSEVFLRDVSPEYAVISSGKNNSYGHPHKEVLDRLRALSIPTYQTAEQGTIRMRTDGVEVWME